MRTLRYAAAASLLLGLAACASDDEPSSDPSNTPSTAPSSPSSSATALDWRAVPGSTDDAVTTNGPWALAVDHDGASWRLSGPAGGSGGGADGWRVSDALLDEDWAVVVLEDEAEQKPSRATVTDLEDGTTFTIDSRSDVPTTTGGTWALGDDRVLHATVDGGAYCLAEVDLESQGSDVAWCAPKRSGFSTAHISDAGDSLLTFDDSQPSCRTVVTVADGDVTPFDGVTDCKGWEGIVTDDGPVWSVIPREQQIESAHFYARSGDDEVDLGPGTAGSLVGCGDAAYFVRDPQQRGQPAALMRWTADDGLTVAYESPKGQAFLEAPRCGGDAITVTARTSSGDEQVTAAL